MRRYLRLSVRYDTISLYIDINLVKAAEYRLSGKLRSAVLCVCDTDIRDTA
jgi:hypothetical protein